MFNIISLLSVHGAALVLFQLSQDPDTIGECNYECKLNLKYPSMTRTQTEGKGENPDKETKVISQGFVIHTQ